LKRWEEEKEWLCLFKNNSPFILHCKSIQKLFYKKC
jgi:hypothetical protein